MTQRYSCTHKKLCASTSMETTLQGFRDRFNGIDERFVEAEKQRDVTLAELRKFYADFGESQTRIDALWGQKSREVSLPIIYSLKVCSCLAIHTIPGRRCGS